MHNLVVIAAVSLAVLIFVFINKPNKSMVSESYYWKKELLKLANKVEKRKNHKRFWTEAQFCTFEKEILIGFYIIRKLIEAYKISNSTISTKVRGRKIPNNGKIVHLLNNHRYIEFYDFGKASIEKFNLIFLCNQLVHSYIFAPFFEETNDDGDVRLFAIHFCSDNDRNKYLYELSIDLIIKIFNTVADDYPSGGIMEFDEKKKDYKVNWHNTPPPPLDLNQYQSFIGKTHKDRTQ